MDILNWIHLVKSKLIKTQLQSSDDLVILGTNQGYDKRGDKYLSYGMKASDFAQALGGGVPGYYEMDVPTSTTVNITTSKGIINVTGANTVFTSALGPFAAQITFLLALPDITDKCYVQFTTDYYTGVVKDSSKPYIIGYYAIPGFYAANIYDLAPKDASYTNQFDGQFRINYELHIIA